MAKDFRCVLVLLDGTSHTQDFKTAEERDKLYRQANEKTWFKAKLYRFAGSWVHQSSCYTRF